jgi:hypothetical protein
VQHAYPDDWLGQGSSEDRAKESVVQRPTVLIPPRGQSAAGSLTKGEGESMNRHQANTVILNPFTSSYKLAR